MLHELLRRECSGGYRETTCPTSVGACHILRRVTNDDHIIHIECAGARSCHALNCNRAEQITVFGIIAKGTFNEVMFNGEALEFELRTATQVASEQAQMNVRMLGEFTQQPLDRRQQATSKGLAIQASVEVRQIALAVSLGTSLFQRQTYIGEELAHHATIRGSGEV